MINVKNRSLILLCSCLLFAHFTAISQSVTRKFVNLSDKPINVLVASEAADGTETISQTIQVAGHNGAFKTAQVNVGEYAWATYQDGTDLKTDRVFINGSRSASDPIDFRPQSSFVDFLGRLGNNNQATRFVGVAYNLNGVDILKYNPRRSIDAFQTEQIFRGLGDETTGADSRSYFLQKSSGTILPVGFKYTGYDNDQSGFMTTTEYLNETKFKKDWNLNVGVAGKHPKGVGGSVDFSYGEEFEKNTSQSHVYYMRQQKNKAYSIALDLNVVQFAPNFINDIRTITNSQSAEAFVNKYGSHYLSSIAYGNQYSQYTSVTRSEYYEAKRKNLSIKVAVEFSKSKPDVKTTTKNGSGSISKEKSEPGSSKSGSGSIGYSQSESKEMREIMSNSKSRYYAIGGTIVGDGDWTTDGVITAIGYDMEEISELMDAKILKSRLTPNDLNGKKALVAAAVKKKLNDLKNYPKAKKLRAFEMQLVTMKIDFLTDDLDRGGKGFFKARIHDGAKVSKPIVMFNVPTMYNGFANNWDLKFPKPEDQNVTTRTWFPFVQQADANGNFQPLKVDFNAEFWDRDHCCGDEHAVLQWGEGIRALKTGETVTHKLKFKDKDVLPLQDFGMEAVVMIRAMDPYFVEPSSFTRSGSTASSGKKPFSKPTVKYVPPTITDAEFNKLSQLGAKVATATPTTNTSPATTSLPVNTSQTTPSKPVTGRNAMSINFGQGGNNLGVYKNMGGKKWQEQNSNGSVFNFEETGRDDWSVYLFDKQRKVYIALDLWQKKVKYKDSINPTYRPLYAVLSATL